MYLNTLDIFVEIFVLWYPHVQVMGMFLESSKVCLPLESHFWTKLVLCVISEESASDS